MGWLSKNNEADDYDKAGDDAAERGSRNSAEMFHDMAASERVEAENDRRNENRKPRRG